VKHASFEDPIVEDTQTKPIDRRSFLSGSFVMGLAGGAGIGALGMKMAEKKFDPYYNERTAMFSYAQNGEDIILFKMGEQINIVDEKTGVKPTYLDIGANDPIAGNNTYLFYKKLGAHGVLVEPNVAHCDNIKKARPGDTVLNVGIGPVETEADYYMIGGPMGDSLNTFDKEMAESYAKKYEGVHYIEKVIKMPLVTINSVIEKHLQGRAPDILSVDTEGYDLKILQSLDYNRFRPPLICAETLVNGSHDLDREIVDLLESKDYVIRGGSFVNSIFIDKKRLMPSVKS
jgi:FkbM family methyltransferase